MAKDPAFLFYTNDFSTGTQFLTDEQLGKYLRLLMAQHQHGHLTEKQVMFICKSYDNDILIKFKKDDNGLFFNERLEDEIFKRKKYTESRSNNKSGRKKALKPDLNNNLSKNEKESYDFHMEDRDINKDINKEEVFKKVMAKKKEKETPLVFPFHSEQFMGAWKVLVAGKKWKSKITHSLQISLNKLSHYEEPFAIELILEAIERDWQGVVFDNTQEKYQEWKNKKSAVHSSDSKIGKAIASNITAKEFFKQKRELEGYE